MTSESVMRPSNVQRTEGPGGNDSGATWAADLSSGPWQRSVSTPPIQWI